MKYTSITDFLTDEEIERAIELNHVFGIREEIIIPNLTRINKMLGQKNDPTYLAYLVKHVIEQAVCRAMN